MTASDRQMSYLNSLKEQAASQDILPADLSVPPYTKEEASEIIDKLKRLLPDPRNRITAKYATGHCKFCGADIKAGQEILYGGRDDLEHADRNICTAVNEGYESTDVTSPRFLPPEDDQEIPF